MARLPSVGGDSNNWGTILNDYLSVVHANDGSLRAGSVDPSTALAGPIAVENGGTSATNAATARTNLAVPQAAGFAKITVGAVAPTSPAVGDIWIDTN